MTHTTNDKGGALNAIANYWFTKFNYEATGEAVAVPEYNLEDGGAQAAIADYFIAKGASTNDASIMSSSFECALHFASVIMQRPLDEAATRGVLAEFVNHTPEAFQNSLVNSSKNGVA